MPAINIGIIFTIITAIVLSYVLKKTKLDLSRFKYTVLITCISSLLAIFFTVFLGITIYGVEQVSYGMIPEALGTNLVIGLVASVFLWKPYNRKSLL